MEAFLKELDEDSQPVPLEPPGRVTFSFDSSGWLYTYHLGVACCLQQQLLGQGPSAEVEEAVGDFAFSGSSGGALVAAALATGVDIYKLADFVISCQEECQYNPWRMFPCTERALHRFIGSNAHEQANGRLRVLLTRIQVLSVKPALRPETVSTFASTHHLKQVLRASCHIPILAGGLPYHVERQQAADGTVVHAGGNFIDGLYWPSVLFMWRAFDRADTLIKVSGLGNPTAAIRPPMPMPLHWVVLPPSPDVLWKIFACGYHDAARWLTRHIDDRDGASSDVSSVCSGSDHAPPPARRRWRRAAQASAATRRLAAKARSARGRAPAGGAVPAPLYPGEMSRIILWGWAQLCVYTLFFPMAVVLIAGMETRRRWHERDDRPLRLVLTYRALHLIEAAAFFALWPLLLGIAVVRWLFVGGRVRPRRKSYAYISSAFASAFASLSEASRSAGTPQATHAGRRGMASPRLSRASSKEL